MNSKQLLETALRRGAREARKSVKKVNAVAATKQKEQLRVKTTTNELIEELKKLSKSIPNISELDGFSKEMLSASFDEIKLKQASSQLKKAQKLIKRIQITTSKTIFSSNKVEEIKKTVNQFIARANSVMKTLDSNIKLIDSFNRELKKYPKLDLQNPVAILVGYPNTGKSSILSRITSAKPKIAEYAFTTKNINMGKMPYKFFELQFLDTPGILDRPQKKRNSVERKAVAALNYLASIVFYVMDASLSSGFPHEKQIDLLKETKELFPKTPLLILLNKTDITPEKELKERKKELEEFTVIECGKGTEKELKEKIKEWLNSLNLKFK
jgi:nucleolar GTP-binding protein